MSSRLDTARANSKKWATPNINVFSEIKAYLCALPTLFPGSFHEARRPGNALQHCLLIGLDYEILAPEH